MVLRNSSTYSGGSVSPPSKWSEVSSQSTLPSFLAMKPSRLAAMWIVTRGFVFSIVVSACLISTRRMKPVHDVRPENQNPDHHRAACCQEDGAGGHILGLLGDGVEIRRGHVGQKLERRVERLRGPDRRDGQSDPAPLVH